MKKIVSVLMAVCLIFSVAVLFGSCGDNSETKNYDTAHHKIKFTIKSNEQFEGGTFVIETYPEYAPETCANFVKLVSEGFYDGLTFHRILPDFMAQGGDPEGNGNGGSHDNIHGEFAANGFAQNTLKHERGVVSMARAKDMNSASSQFFICYSDSPSVKALDGSYAAFGKVTEGMETVDGFLNVDRVMGGDGAFSSPKYQVVIEKAEVIE